MGNQRQRLFTLLLIAVGAHTVISEERQMSMSPSAVDDQFSGCREEMWKKVTGKGGLLQKELRDDVLFHKAWNSGKCGKTIPGGKQQHAMAVVAYSHGSSEFRQAFDSAMESKGGNGIVYSSGFPYKSFHFLLMDAVRLLQSGQCHTVHHSSEHRYRAEVGKEVRFGRFVSTRTGQRRGTGTLFHITSCAVADVTDHACRVNDTELLIPPFEVFKVEEVKTTDNHTEIALNHTRLYSYHDCYHFPRSVDSSSSESASCRSLLLLATSLCLCLYVLEQIL